MPMFGKILTVGKGAGTSLRSRYSESGNLTRAIYNTLDCFSALAESA